MLIPLAIHVTGGSRLRRQRRQKDEKEEHETETTNGGGDVCVLVSCYTGFMSL